MYKLSCFVGHPVSCFVDNPVHLYKTQYHWNQLYMSVYSQESDNMDDFLLNMDKQRAQVYLVQLIHLSDMYLSIYLFYKFKLHFMQAQSSISHFTSSLKIKFEKLDLLFKLHQNHIRRLIDFNDNLKILTTWLQGNLPFRPFIDLKMYARNK